jgi:Transcription factor WhiB
MGTCVSVDTRRNRLCGERVVLVSEVEISIYCEASRHNTLESSRKRNGRKPCICPRALELAQQRRVEERSRRRDRRRDVSGVPRATPKPIVATPPDLSKGLCTSGPGVKIALAGMNDQTSSRAIREREEAKRLCNTCPIRDTLCRPWVLGQEDPPGSWGGVWGGMDSWNRRGLQLIARNGKAETVPYDINRS